MSVFPDVDLTVLPKTLEAEVPEEYLDAMGHVNVVWYTHYFSEGMLGFFDYFGISDEDLSDRKIGRFALETHIRYFREVHLGDKIQIYSRFIARNEKRFHALNFMWNSTTSELSAMFEMVGMCIDMEKRRPAPIPEDLAVAIDQVIAEHGKLDWDPPLCGVMGPR